LAILTDDPCPVLEASVVGEIGRGKNESGMDGVRVGDAVEDLVKRELGRLREEAYALTLARGRALDRLPAEWRLTLRPTRPTAAAMEFVGDDEDWQIDVRAGSATLLEIQAEGSWQPLGTNSPQSEVQAVTHAIVRGSLRERVWMIDEDIAKSRSEIDFDGRTIRTHYMDRGHSPGEAKLLDLHYTPYDEKVAR
jgi:hypothetical protein